MAVQAQYCWVCRRHDTAMGLQQMMGSPDGHYFTGIRGAIAGRRFDYIILWGWKPGDEDRSESKMVEQLELDALEHLKTRFSTPRAYARGIMTLAPLERPHSVPI